MDVYDMDKAAFGAFVAGLRKEKGWTQRELAEQLHITDKAVSKWETGVSLR
ncbi:helix-turn-helix domain-containing protein [Flavonifractor porci]|uniref:helix-turn-helix domain-containing protein n=1 Tax=Flavonifractor porci TaxID=3133422 RepID=UPI0030A36A78